MKCKISIVLAYIMLVYILASVYYMIRSRWEGTPFKDSLTKDQIIIQKASSKRRTNIFLQGLLVAVVLSAVFRPFRKC